MDAIPLQISGLQEVRQAEYAGLSITAYRLPVTGWSYKITESSPRPYQIIPVTAEGDTHNRSWKAARLPILTAAAVTCWELVRLYRRRDPQLAAHLEAAGDSLYKAIQQGAPGRLIRFRTIWHIGGAND